MKVLVTSSRVATAKMIDFAINLVKRAEETGQVTFIVGDADGNVTPGKFRYGCLADTAGFGGNLSRAITISLMAITWNVIE